MPQPPLPPAGDRAARPAAAAADTAAVDAGGVAASASASAVEPPRPLWLTETYPPSRGGMAQSCDRIVHALRTLGISVDVVHLDRRQAPAASAAPAVAGAEDASQAVRADQAFPATSLAVRGEQAPLAARADEAPSVARAECASTAALVAAGRLTDPAVVQATYAAGLATQAATTRPPAVPAIVRRRRGRDIRWPVEADPAHALRSLWSRLENDPERIGITHVVAFGGQLPLLAGPVFAAWLGVPLVTLLRGNDLDAGIFHPQRAGAVYRALERSARVCAVSRDKAEQAAALVPGAPRPAVIPTGIDLARWAPLAGDLERAAAWRRTVPPGLRVLGFFGQIKRKKGAIFLLDALRRGGLAGRFHVRFAGQLDDEVTSWLAEHGGALAHGVEPFDDRYRLLERYPACDLVVLPSLYDGTPNVLAEAAALGVPFLAARTGGMADLLIEGVHGFLFAPGSDDEIAAALGRAAAASDDDLRRMGDACRDLARARLDHLQEAAAYLEVLRETQRASGARSGG